MADWDEIKRLAADFQRTQTSDTLQRISERNCIDIIKKLTDLDLIELIYTCDGKEFITPSHLLREIEDEIYVNGGRMHLHDLAANLNVDYQHVENKAKELARDKSEEYSLILGQIIHSTYKMTLGKLVSDCMLDSGQLSIADFAKSLDLPSEFLLAIVKEILPKLMDDFVESQDGRTYYTKDMMDRYKSIIAGTLSAISKPTSIASLMKRLDIPERIFTPTIEALIKEGRIDALVENRLFIPAVYAREQNEWIDRFYSSNSYIEYDVLTRMDIKQPKTFLRKKFPDGFQLKTCFVSPILISQVESLIEESIATNGWIDISTIVPSAIEAEDIEQLLQDLFKRNKQFNTSCLVFEKTNVCSLGFIATCKSSFKNLMQNRAKEHLNEGKLMSYFMGTKIKNHSPPQPPPTQSTTPAVSAPPQDLKDGEVDGGKIKQIDPKDSSCKDKDEDIDPEAQQSGKGSKKEKKGAQVQGREIKQKNVKKKYIPGMKNVSKNIDESDEIKAPKNARSRAARRGVSPEREKQTSNIVPKKETLTFMNSDQIVSELSRKESCDFFDAIADMIEDDLNKAYEKIAKETLEEYLSSLADEEKETMQE